MYLLLKAGFDDGHRECYLQGRETPCHGHVVIVASGTTTAATAGACAIGQLLLDFELLTSRHRHRMRAMKMGIGQW